MSCAYLLILSFSLTWFFILLCRCEAVKTMMNYIEESLGNQLASSFNISYVFNADCDSLSFSFCRYSASFIWILESKVMFFCYLPGFSVFCALLFCFLHWFFHFNKLQVSVWASSWPFFPVFLFSYSFCFVGHSETFGILWIMLFWSVYWKERD